MGTNVFRDLPSNMQIYSVVNMKIYEPPMIMDQQESVSIPSVDEFSPDYLNDLKEYIIMDRRMRTLRRGDVEYLGVVLKVTHPSKEKWFEKEKVRRKFHHLPGD
jgi:hypothetical protein